MKWRIVQIDVVAGLHRRPENEFVLAERHEMGGNTRIVFLPIGPSVLHPVQLNQGRGIEPLIAKRRTAIEKFGNHIVRRESIKRNASDDGNGSIFLWQAHINSNPY